MDECTNRPKQRSSTCVQTRSQVTNYWTDGNTHVTHRSQSPGISLYSENNCKSTMQALQHGHSGDGAGTENLGTHLGR